MDPNLVKLTAGALAGLASRDFDRHGHTAPTTEELGRRAVEMAKGALGALEEIETDPSPATKPAKPRAR